LQTCDTADYKCLDHENSAANRLPRMGVCSALADRVECLGPAADQRRGLCGRPLDDIANVAKRAGVMVRGLWLPEREIQERLRNIAQSYRP
jgi:hypothetical protein